MDKIKMAHDYVISYLGSSSCKNTTLPNLVSLAWQYADAMLENRKI